MGLFEKLCIFGKKTISAVSAPLILPTETTNIETTTKETTTKETTTKETTTKTDLEVKALYLAFRLDPINDKYNDTMFLSRNSIPMSQLERVVALNPDIADTIDRREIGNKDIQLLSNKILQQCYNTLLEGKVSAKSYEGLLNAANNLLKTIQLITGNPTERVEIKDLEKKTPEELHRFVMGRLRDIA